MIFLVLSVLLVCAAPDISPAQVPGQKLASDGIFTDPSGKTYVRVTLNGSVRATLLYQEDLPYVLLTRKIFNRLKVSLKGRPGVVVQVGKSRVKAKTFVIQQLAVGSSVSEGVQGAVIVGGALPVAQTDGAIGKHLLEQLPSLSGLLP